MAHAADRIDFAPGATVSVPFRPRASDSWLVDGGAPRALPAGRLSGAAMRDSAARPAPPARVAPQAAPVDGPVGVPSMDASPSVALAPSSPSTAAPAASSGLRKQVFGFLPYWELGSSTTVLNDDLLSTIAYFSVGADRNGNLLTTNADGSKTTGWAGWTSAALTNVINAAHAHGTRVVLTVSVFAWTSGEAATQAALLGSTTAQLNLARQAAAAVRNRGADGVNLDFEPIVSGYSTQFAAFVRTMRQQLSAISPGYQLTFDATGFIGNYPLEAATASGAADAVFIMGYDYRTGSSTTAGSIDPLTGPTYDITDTLVAYLDRIPASKVILGVPYYGRAWSTADSTVRSRNISGTQYGVSTSVVYDTAKAYLDQYGRRWDTTEQVAWTAYQRQNCTTTYGCVTAWRELYVDDATALRAKYDLVNRFGLRGVGMWALGYDGTRPELYQALAAAFLNDTTPPEVGIEILPPTTVDEGIVVSWTGRDDSGIRSYDVQASTDGGSWTAWLTATTATREAFPGRDGHGYAFRVRATDVKGNVSAWNVTSTSAAAPTIAPGGFASVLADTLNLRSGPTTSAAILTTLSAGSILAVTGGPVSADGYTWVQVAGPLTSWGTVGFVQLDGWVAVGGLGSTFLVARQAPNSTLVRAGITGLSFGGGGLASVGTAGSALRTFSPNGDGIGDTIRLDWTNRVAFSSLTLAVHRSNGSLAGSVALAGMGAVGAHSFIWNGSIGPTALADGTYVLQLVGIGGATTYTAPSAYPVTAGQIAAYGVTIDHLPVTRLGGSDRYATAALVSEATFPAGAPVAYIATGATFPDALSGAVAAARAGGPVLLVSPIALPAATAAELTRLRPSRIVILGGSGAVSASVATAARSAGL